MANVRTERMANADSAAMTKVFRPTWLLTHMLASAPAECNLLLSEEEKGGGLRDLPLPRAVVDSPRMIDRDGWEATKQRWGRLGIPIVLAPSDEYADYDHPFGISNLVLVGAEEVSKVELVALTGTETVLVSVMGTGENELAIPVVGGNDILPAYDFTTYTQFVLRIELADPARVAQLSVSLRLTAWMIRRDNARGVLAPGIGLYAKRQGDISPGEPDVILFSEGLCALAHSSDVNLSEC